MGGKTLESLTFNQNSEQAVGGDIIVMDNCNVVIKIISRLLYVITYCRHSYMKPWYYFNG
jgi:hypothetical protein